VRPSTTSRKTGVLPGLDGPAPKTFLHGSHRVLPPEKTVERVRGLQSVIGITRVANVTGLDRVGIPVFMVCRPNARSIAISQGKGLDFASARASGLMESIEGYHAERITLPLKFASYEELRYTHNLPPIEELPRPIDSVFHPHLRLLWIEGYDLLQQASTWVPYELVHLDYTLPFPPGMGCFVASSNGLASGNHLLEAISHAICEVVERDALALWNLKSDRRKDETRINLETVDDPDCRELLSKYERARISVVIWDVTSGVGIPAFFSLIADGADNPLHPLPPANGSGCHPVREVALLRALTEAAQGRLTYITGSRDDIPRTDYKRMFNPRDLQHYRQLAEVRGSRRDFCNIPSRKLATFQEDVEWELGRLESGGIKSVIVVDLTKPEFRLPVVRVVIPQMELAENPMDSIPGRRAMAILENPS
jgi:YcaO-like protein with predicted kinase domain